MFDRFWQKYPQGSILSDLVQIHEDLYVVRVTLASAGQPLVATLAAAHQLEMAEASARNQAMQMLGCEEAVEMAQPTATALPAETVLPLSPLEPSPAQATTLSKAEPSEVNSLEPASDFSLTAANSEQLKSLELPDKWEPLVSTSLAMESLSINDSCSTPLEVVAAVVNEQERPAKTRSKKSPAIPVESPQPDTDTDPATDVAPLSVTDIIPLINMELKRLNWSREQGRDYMVSLYNKRASSLLSDEELFGLLQHLRDESGAE